MSSRPNRKALLGVGAALVVLAAIGVTLAVTRSSEPAGPDRAADPRPNVVVIMTDDQTLESMRVLTDVNRLIGSEGVTFDDNVVSFPLCCPSRATYLTGQYGHNNGVMGNQPPNGGYTSFHHQETAFPVALQRAGYRTVHIGKYLNGYKRPAATIPPGWDDWQGSLDPSTYQYRGFTLLTKDGERHYGRRPADYQTDVYADLAVQAIERQHREGKPFFLNVAFLAPHNQVTPGAAEDQAGAPVPAAQDAEAFAHESLPADASFDEADVSDKPAAIRSLPRITARQRNEITRSYRARLESLLAVDRATARIIKALEADGELDRTAVIFTSDNGFMHGEHRIQDGKGQVYEPSVHVPLLMRGPGLPRGVTRRGMTANIDLAPTILDLADATPLRKMDGHSLVPLARAEQGEDRGILLEMGGPYSRTAAIRTRRYVYIERPTGERELYDLERDPDELDNRQGDPALATVQASLAKRLTVLRACAGSTCAGT